MKTDPFREYLTQVKLTIPELEQVAEANGWVDVCKETEN